MALRRRVYRRGQSLGCYTQRGGHYAECSAYCLASSLSYIVLLVNIVLMWRMQRFGEKLRTLRQRRGLTLRDFALALGHPASFNSYLSDVENGRRTPKTPFVLEVAQFFGVTPDVLLLDQVDLPGAESASEAGEATPE